MLRRMFNTFLHATTTTSLPFHHGTSMTHLPGLRSRPFSANAPLLLTILKGVFIGHFLGSYVGSFYRTQGPSMLPTISASGDVIYVSKLYRRGKNVKVGDVINCRHPTFPDVGIVKRVVGMPGDFVARDGVGRSMIQVPEGHCWVLGDNLPHSRDSRTYGPIPLALIKGKVIGKVWPWAERKWIGNTVQRPR